MDKESKISLSLNQKTESGAEEVKLSAPATCALIDGRHFIKYEEKTDDGAVNKVLLKFDEASFEMTKSGEVKSTLIFEKGKRTSGLYRTPYGNFAIETDTGVYDLKLYEEEIKVRLEYVFFIDGEKIAECELDILVRLAQNF